MYLVLCWQLIKSVDFLRTVQCFLIKFYSVILDITLLCTKLKKGWRAALCWGSFFGYFWNHLNTFSYFVQNFLVYLWGSLNKKYVGLLSSWGILECFGPFWSMFVKYLATYFHLNFCVLSFFFEKLGNSVICYYFV